MDRVPLLLEIGGAAIAIREVSLFLPCIADTFYPAIGRAAIEVLKKAGFKVRYPEHQTCCGQWAVNLGRPDAARHMARHFLSVFDQAETVVSPSGSCVLTVREYPKILQDTEWSEKAEAMKGKVFELTDFLVNVAGVVDLGARLEGKATLHDSCHPLRGLGLKAEPRALLGMIEGLSVVEMPDPEVCCGFGGAFMAKYPPLSKAIADQKIDQAVSTGADWLVMTEPGCLMNVDSALKDRGLPLKAIHLAELLALGLRGDHA
jgi:L-lactate dehydrogenase complex protein LldE